MLQTTHVSTSPVSAASIPKAIFSAAPGVDSFVAFTFILAQDGASAIPKGKIADEPIS